MLPRRIRTQVIKKLDTSAPKQLIQPELCEQRGILTKDAIALIADQNVPGVCVLSVHDNLDFVQKKFAETKSARATAEALGELLAAKEKTNYFDF